MGIEFTDTHAHLYLKTFKKDVDEVIERALANGVTRMFLPNIDSSTLEALLQVCDHHSSVCFPMIGLHPTSVKENYMDELEIVNQHLQNERFIAVGEIGIDLYWDKSYLKQQQAAFRQQLHWAKEADLPVVIHARDSFDEIFQIMDEENSPELNGVFHSFTGNIEQVQKILSYDFYIGINGIVTFKNSGLQETIKTIPPEKLLIETDCPFLAPVPYRGKRNESSYVTEVAHKIIEIYEMELSDLALITNKNALSLFKRAN